MGLRRDLGPRVAPRSHEARVEKEANIKSHRTVRKLPHSLSITHSMCTARKLTTDVLGLRGRNGASGLPMGRLAA